MRQVPRVVRALAVAVLAAPALTYVAPRHGGMPLRRTRGAARAAKPQPEFSLPADERAELLGVAAASFGVGAILGWLRSRKQEAASLAAAVALAPAAAQAIVDYDAINYLGGSDKVDLNNANLQAYRQFPGMYPTAAGAIATHGPYKDIADIYNIPNLDQGVKSIMKQYEGNFVLMPPNQAYAIDRVNNGMYR
mmetsp:Transcript_557/g.1384  ORF Transcript_557/g.1384 Transcript_557/m.1384 type:complete len:193 (-) Transcript_557:171-749(-)